MSYRRNRRARHERRLPFEHVGVRHGPGYHGSDDYEVRGRYEEGHDENDDYDWRDEDGRGNFDYSDEESGDYGYGQSRRGSQFGNRSSYPSREHQDYSRRQQPERPYQARRGYDDYESGRSHDQTHRREYDYESPGEEWRLGRRHYGSYGKSQEGIEGLGEGSRVHSGMEPRYRGIGPKNWTRSDDRISDDINEYLTEDYFIDARDVSVTVKNGEITLSGSVESRQAKRRAEDIAEQITGVNQVHNQLRVASRNEDWSSQENKQKSSERKKSDKE